MPFSQPSSPPPTVPIFGLSDEEIGRGWRRVNIGELIQSHFEVFGILPPNVGWHISAYTTKNGYHSNGTSHYRAPASLRAWMRVAIPTLKKLWRAWRSGS